MTQGHTTVLLGAGASFDAGIPMSVDLTTKIGECIEAYEKSTEQTPHGPAGQGELTWAFRGTLARLLAFDAYRGGNPLGGVDVERFFSAVEMLAEADTLEVAPFVREWHHGFPLQANTPDLGWLAHNVIRTIENKDSSALVNALELVRDAQADYPRTYASLGRAMIRALKSVLTPDEASRHDYLQPLFNTQPCRIATLNYDLGVENAAERAGRVLTDGIAEWTGGLDWSWGEGGDVQLLKLHGSLNWALRMMELASCVPPGETRFEHVLVGDSLRDPEYFDPRNGLATPGLVFGARGKLRPDGPFLAMLVELSRWLKSTERLIVVGYSFRDRHINRLIQDWLEERDRPILEVIDPGLPEDAYSLSSRPGGLLWGLLDYVTHRDLGCPGPPTWWQQNPTIRLHREPASSALLRLLGLPSGTAQVASAVTRQQAP